ncbi:hypothetical protein C0585_03170 [Candidatus Woesearchaeota archaeon]|nr:MAG: hypothetical protein C0585_03170 [Candidatus Woesearchaeota archaeon]
MKISFVNIIGEYLFEEKNGKLFLIDSREFSKKEQEELVTKGIDSIKKKFSGEEPTNDQLKKILQILKNDAKKFKDFDTKNTKKNIRESVSDDNLIIQTVGLIEDLEKVNNTLSKRLREWHSLYAPEISNKIGDNEGFSKAVSIKTKDELFSELKITESMGASLKKSDVEEIIKLAKQVKELFDEKKAKEKYLETLMKRHAPNVYEIVGTMIGSKLITFAGSVRQLSLMPAGTIQLLGAETALFRHIKSGSKPPKHGFIINHPIVTGVPRKDKGKAARALADKISICAKVDYFKGEPIGETLKLELMKKF